MAIDGVIRSTGADCVLAVAADGANLSLTVTDRSGTILMGRAAVPADRLTAVLSDKPTGPRTLADGVIAEVRRNEVWLAVGGAAVAVGLDDLTDAVADAG